ncbi:MAG: DUF5786 family protein [Halobacteriales archaeon]
MGFGSYDESEQEKQGSESDVNEDDAVSVQDAKHDGDVSYNTEASSDELLDQLQDIKDDRDE